MIFFVNIGPRLSNNIINGNLDFKKYLSNNYNLQFTFEPINEEYGSTIIDKLKNRSSSVYGGILATLLKELKPTIIKPLTLIINQSLKTGIPPSKLKIAKVIPVLKKRREDIV